MTDQRIAGNLIAEKYENEDCLCQRVKVGKLVTAENRA